MAQPTYSPRRLAPTTPRAAARGSSGPVPDEPAGALTLSGWVEDHWLPLMRSRVKPSTWDSYDRNLALHVLPHLGDLPLDQITPMRLNSLYGHLLEDGKRTGPGGLSAKTVRNLANVIHEALGDAVDADLLPTNPAHRAKPPRPSQVAPMELHCWTPDELRRFLEFSRNHHLAVALRLAATTGLRRGELLGVRWVDVDLEAGRLAVRHTVISIAYQVRESTPKTHQARVVDLDTETVGQLRAHRDRRMADRADLDPAVRDTDLVFCRTDGRPIHPDFFTQSFTRLVARSGLPRIRLHDLRHTHASIALAAGVSVKVVSERLGHSTPGFTLRVYAHVLPSMQAEAAAKVAALVDGTNAS